MGVSEKISGEFWRIVGLPRKSILCALFKCGVITDRRRGSPLRRTWVSCLEGKLDTLGRPNTNNPWLSETDSGSLLRPMCTVNMGQSRNPHMDGIFPSTEGAQSPLRNTEIPPKMSRFNSESIRPVSGEDGGSPVGLTLVEGRSRKIGRRNDTPVEPVSEEVVWGVEEIAIQIANTLIMDIVECLRKCTHYVIYRKCHVAVVSNFIRPCKIGRRWSGKNRKDRPKRRIDVGSGS